MKIVLDTNIYLASLLNEGLCRELTRYIFDLKNEQEVFISPETNLELFNKIASKKEASSSNNLDWLICQLNEVAVLIQPQEKILAVIRDPSDNKILECAVACHADLIITMDKDLLKLKNFRNIGIVHPKTFVYMLGK
jgi:putative PIN family toxin of toxin-antitoxin system